MFNPNKKYKVGDLVEMKFQDRMVFAKVTKVSENGIPLEYEIGGAKQKTLEGLVIEQEAKRQYLKDKIYDEYRQDNLTEAEETGWEK